MDYAAYAEMAAKYAHGKLTRGSSNWKDFSQKKMRKADAVTIRMVKEVQTYQLNIGIDKGETPGSVSFSRLPKLYDVAHALRVAEEASFMGAGNCGEFSAVVFAYLYKRDILPLDIMASTYFDHAWVVIGRPANTDVTDPNGWTSEDDPNEPVICDPWLAKGNTPYTNRDKYHEMVVDLEDYRKYYAPTKVKLLLRAGKKAQIRDDSRILYTQ